MLRPRPLRPMLTKRLAEALLAATLLAALATTGCPLGGRDDVLVLARRGDPTSQAIAVHYAEHAGLGSDAILELTLTIPLGSTRIDAASYRREIAEPIERHLILSGTADDARRIVTTRGLPLLVEACEDGKACERATLESALAQLGRTGDDRPFARLANPFFRDLRAFDDFADDHPDAALRFLVSRVDGSPGDGDGATACPQRIRDALAKAPRPESAPAPVWHVAAPPTAERTTATRLLLDPVADRLPSFGHRVCEGCEEARATGLVVASAEAVDPLPHLEGPGFVSSLRGTPTTARKGRRSAFAETVDRWLDRGATAIALHLSDPTLADVARPEVQLEAFARGRTAAEAYYASLPVLGGSQVLVGDGMRAIASTATPEALEDDRDGDGVVDREDNCPRDPNPDQRDTNGDGLGNLCDADVDDDGDVDSSEGRIYPVDARGDLEAVILTARNGPYDPDHDLDGDGRVDENDLLRVQLALSRPPGR